MRNLKRIGVFWYLATALLFLAPYASSQEFSTPINISNNPGSMAPQILVDNQGNINVVWIHYHADGSEKDVLFSRSFDGGQTFNNPINVSNNRVPGKGYVDIAVDNLGKIFITWNEYIPEIGMDRACFSRSIDGGQTFSSPLILSTRVHPGSPILVGVDGLGNINISWRAWPLTTSSPLTVYYCRSTDSGATFSFPVPVSFSIKSANIHQMAVDQNGKIYIAWSEYVSGTSTFSLWITSSSDGLNFSSPVPVHSLPYPSSLEIYLRNKLAFDSAGNLTIMWIQCMTPDWWDDPDSWEIFLSSSADGINFSTPLNISDDMSRSEYASIVVDQQDNINVIWQDTKSVGSTSISDVFYCRSLDGGQTFCPAINISEYTGIGYGAQALFAVDFAGNIDVLLFDLPGSGGHPQVWFTRSADGIYFSEPLNLSNTPYYPSGPGWIDVDEKGTVYIVYISPSWNVGDVFFTRGIFNQAPVADAGADRTLSVGEVAEFDGTGSYDPDPDGSIISYEWDFGDGATATGSVVTHAYDAKGTYTVTLTVTDNNGASSIDTLTVDVVNSPPVAHAGGPYLGAEGTKDRNFVFTLAANASQIHLIPTRYHAEIRLSNSKR